MLCSKTMMIILITTMLTTLDVMSSEAQELSSVYLSLRGTNYFQNNSDIVITEIGQVEDLEILQNGTSGDALACHTNLEQCCTRSRTENGQSIGNWFLPNGLRVYGQGRGIYIRRGDQIVALNRENEATRPIGLYCCVIENRSGQNVTFCANLIRETVGTISSEGSTTGFEPPSSTKLPTTVTVTNTVARFFPFSLDGALNSNNACSPIGRNMIMTAFVIAAIPLIIVLLIVASVAIIVVVVTKRKLRAISKVMKTMQAHPHVDRPTSTVNQNEYESIGPEIVELNEDHETPYREFESLSGQYDYADRETVLLHRSESRDMFTVSQCEAYTRRTGRSENMATTFIDDGVYY